MELPKSPLPYSSLKKLVIGKCQLFLKNRTLVWRVSIAGTLGVFFICLLFYHFFISAPIYIFVDGGKIVTIKVGDNASSIALRLEEQKVIRSAFCFKVLTTIYGKDDQLTSGDYVFKSPASCLVVVGRLTNSRYGLVPQKVTIPEGLNVSEIADLLADIIPAFDLVKFIEIGRDKEGYLFPDTYFFFPNVSSGEVIKKMEDNFKSKIESVRGNIDNFKKPLTDVIIVASIIEDEAITSDDRRIVSGILWKRLKMKMPLQVDALFRYLDGKGTFDLTTEDLATTSPYNTYKYIGLPPTPINNPGLDSILAAVEPKKTNYLYFVSDKKGVMHYAATFEEHQRNRELYLGR